jgi:hypothetical protein
VGSKDCANEVLDGSNDSIGNSCYILAKNLSKFCPFPGNLWGAEFKTNGLINQLLLAALSQVYSENLEQKCRVERL